MPRGLWYGSNKCSSNHVKKEKSSLQLGLTNILAETNIFHCTPLGANFIVSYSHPGEGHVLVPLAPQFIEITKGTRRVGGGTPTN